jgi:hypothetical protein
MPITLYSPSSISKPRYSVKRAIQSAQRIGVVELLDLVNSAVLAVAEEGGRVLALAVDAEDRRLLPETGAMVGAGRMRQVVLDGHDFGRLEIKTELQQTPFDAFSIAEETPVAGQEGVQRPIRRIPVAFGIVPAGAFGEADRRKRNGHRVDLGRLDAGKFQAELRRFVGHAILGVLVADEALLFRCGNELAIDVQRGRRIVGQRAGKSE